MRSHIEGNRADFNYLGLDGKMRQTRVLFEPTPTHLSPSLASFQLDLEPHESVSLFCTISCDRDQPPPPPFLKSLRSAHRELKRIIRVGTEIETSNRLFNEVLRRHDNLTAGLDTPSIETFLRVAKHLEKRIAYMGEESSLPYSKHAPVKRITRNA